MGHAWPLTGAGAAPRIAGIPVFTLAVYVFFAVSGYLIASSWSSAPDVRGFLVRRSLRIFPALIVTVLATTFLVGPAMSVLDPVAYFADPLSWKYLSNVTLIATYDLPGVFLDHPRTAVNGSLWTLGPEFVCYLGVLGAGVVVRAVPGSARVAAQHLVAGGAVVALAVAALVFSGSPAAAMAFFAVGALVSHLARGRALPLWPAPVLLAAWLAVGTWFPELSLPCAWIAVPYSVLAVGLRSTPVVRRFGRFGDFSYGLYLWGYPVQQLVYGTAPGIPLWLDVVLVLLAAGAIAALSWYTVEARALRFARAYRRSPPTPQRPPAAPAIPERRAAATPPACDSSTRS